MKLPLLFALGLTVVASSAPAVENQYAAQMKAYLAAHIAQWVEDPVIVDAIKAQNAKTAGYSQGQIDTLDKAWTAEVGQAATPTITPVLTNAASDFLRKEVVASGGAIVEAFVEDARGLNVACAAPTSDYWQGDEAKWQNTYPKGAGAIDIGKVDFDESSQTYQAQISTTITDPATGQPIGAITIGLNVEALK